MKTRTPLKYDQWRSRFVLLSRFHRIVGIFREWQFDALTRPRRLVNRQDQFHALSAFVSVDDRVLTGVDRLQQIFELFLVADETNRFRIARATGSTLGGELLTDFLVFRRFVFEGPKEDTVLLDDH